MTICKKSKKGIKFWKKNINLWPEYLKMIKKIRIKIWENMKFGITICVPLLAHQNVEKDRE